MEIVAYAAVNILGDVRKGAAAMWCRVQAAGIVAGFIAAVLSGCPTLSRAFTTGAWPGY